MATINYYNEPKVQKFNLEGVKHISAQDALEIMKNEEAYLIDVRVELQAKQTYFEFQNVFNIPLHKLPEKIEFIPKELDLIIICNTGNDSVKATNFFNRQDYKNVYNLDGGISEWKRLKLPVIETTYSEIKEHTPCSGGCTGCS